MTPLLDAFVEHAPAPLPRATVGRIVDSTEPALTGFVFKIQANMDPAHRDRIAFMRICSGSFERGMRLFHVRLGKEIRSANALTFMAREREQVETAWPGDIVGLHNHGTIVIGDTFTEGESLQFTGIPNFAPELFRRAQLRDPLKLKALQKGLLQLSEEGATQFFRPLASNDLILGAVGMLQFDVVAYRLKHEYNVDARFMPSKYRMARWVTCDDPREMRRFIDANAHRVGYDAVDAPTFLAAHNSEIEVAQERWKGLRFHTLREHAGLALHKG